MKVLLALEARSFEGPAGPGRIELKRAVVPGIKNFCQGKRALGEMSFQRTVSVGAKQFI